MIPVISIVQILIIYYDSIFHFNNPGIIIVV